jgi:hypothetical protein
VCFDGKQTSVLLEGHGDDVRTESTRAALTDGPAAVVPDGPHRGRISVAPARLDAVAARLAAVPGCGFLAEYGVGTVHVAGDHPAVLDRAREIAHEHGGWMLREQGSAPGFDGFGVEFPNAALQRRVRDAFDPQGKCNPGRLP